MCCVWVKGHVPFTVQYATKLEAMTRRFLSRPFEFVCLTDRPRQVPAHIRTIQITLTPGCKGWWAKLEVFKAERFQGRVLYLDLDTLIVDALDPVVDYPAPFALIPHAGTFDGGGGRAVVKRFNSSVMVWDAETQSHLHTTWTPLEAQRLWGDQDWIGEQCPDAAAMPAAWFPRISEVQPPWPVGAKVVLMKVPKNHVAAKRWPWMQEAWA